MVAALTDGDVTVAKKLAFELQENHFASRPGDGSQ